MREGELGDKGINERKKFMREKIINSDSVLNFNRYIPFNIKYTSKLNPLKTKRRLLYLRTQFVPRSKHFSSRL